MSKDQPIDQASKSLIGDVSDTSFWVAYYRVKESERADALFRDPLAKVLVGDRGKLISDSMSEISFYTEWAVISRTVIIDRFIHQALKDGVDGVINLGAGLDTRPYRMDLPESLEWIEVDYPKIIAHKNEILKSERPKCKLTRVAVDLANAQARLAFLKSALPEAKKVLIITEGVIPYLSPEQVTDLSNDLLSQKRFALWIMEYFHKKVYRYLKRSVRELNMRNAPFRFYPDDWFAFFSQLGWQESETRFGVEIAKEFKRKLPMPKWAALIMPFLPKKVKEASGRMSGYVILRRK
jgi:methyltransferase (TIGR00027 family)